MEENETRLNKYLSEVGFCSRREADKLISEGKVRVNGRIPEMGTKVSSTDDIRVNGNPITPKQEGFVYLAFHKPVGVECTTNRNSKYNIIDFLNYPQRIFPVGRLDKDSEGLIFMTNDGDIVNKILRAGNEHEKEYIVTVDKPITPEFIKRMGNGIPILGTMTKKCKVEQISKFIFQIYLTQGLNRQIRRMCKFLGYEVTALKRIRIMNVELDIPVGSYRHFRPDELKALNKLIAASTMTEEASPVEMRVEKTEGRATPFVAKSKTGKKNKAPGKFTDTKKGRAGTKSSFSQKAPNPNPKAREHRKGKADS